MLSILHPVLFGIGLACIAIPIIIHLLRRKRKPVTWGAMRFLEHAYRKRKRILTIEQLILLATRCILVALIAVGVGGVLFGSVSSSDAPRSVTIVLDNSIGSALIVGDQTELARSKQAALRAIDQLDASRGDRAALITLGSPASAPIMRPTTDLDAVRAAINASKPVDSSADYAGMIDLIGAQEPQEDESTRSGLLLLSAFRGLDQSSFGTLDGPSLSDRFDAIEIRAPGGAPAANTAITSVTPSRAMRLDDSAAAMPLSVRISLQRSGPLEDSITGITITDANSGVTIATGSHRWEASVATGSVVVPIRPNALSTLRAGSSAVIATIDDDANPRDNAGACIIRLRQRLQVGVIESTRNSSTTGTISAATALRAALAPSDTSPIDLVFVDPLRISSPRLYEIDALIVLAPNALTTDSWAAIANAARNGLAIIITPDSDAPSADWIGELSQLGVESPAEILIPTTHDPAIALSESLPGSATLGALEAEFALLARSVRITKSIDLSTIHDAQAVVSLDDGSPFIVQLNHQQGSLILLSSAIDLGWTDLPARPLFVPMIQELVRQSVGGSGANDQGIAGRQVTNSTSRYAFLRPLVERANAQSEDPTRSSGLFAALDDQGAARSIIAINPDDLGTDTTTISKDTLGEQITRAFQFEAIDWILDDPSTPDGTNKAESLAVAGSGFGFAALIFLAAALLGLVELTLARLFSFSSTSLDAGGAR